MAAARRTSPPFLWGTQGMQMQMQGNSALSSQVLFTTAEMSPRTKLHGARHFAV